MAGRSGLDLDHGAKPLGVELEHSSRRALAPADSATRWASGALIAEPSARIRRSALDVSAATTVPFAIAPQALHGERQEVARRHVLEVRWPAASARGPEISIDTTSSDSRTASA